MMFEGKPFEGQVALITGGGTGLGRAMAHRLADYGATIAIASRSAEHLEPTAKEIRDKGGTCIWRTMDVRDPAKVEETVSSIVDECGKIDILINNAAGNFICPAEKLSINGWNAIVGIVLHGTWHCTSAVGRHMIERGEGGRMLSIVATYAWTGAAYVMPSAVAKAGVLAMTRSLAVEWGPKGIRLNAIAPGAIVTEGASANLKFDTEDAQSEIAAVNPMGRLGTQDELADLAAFLLSDYSSWINGDCVTMDGGGWMGGGFGRRRAAAESGG